jgi:hypothetical protein
MPYASGADLKVEVVSSGGDMSVEILTMALDGGASITADDDGQIVIEGGDAQFPVQIGRGLPLGQPTGTPSLATNGAGNVNGTVQYAYTESDNSGETTLSASASIAATNNTIRVTMPQPRRGTISRKLYRTASGGSTFKLVHEFNSGTGFFATLWDDSVADGSLGADAPSTDASALYELSIGRGVKNLMTHPDQLTAPGDLTICTHDPATPGTFCVHAYGPVVSYAPDTSSVCYYALKTGTTGNLFQGDTCPTLHADPEVTTTRFLVTANGSVQLTPATLADDSNNAIRLTATFPTVKTANRQAVYFGITGAGSSNFSEQAFAVDHLAGYTGGQTAYAFHVQQANVGNGSSSAVVGLQARNTGAAFQNVGLSGVVTAGTHQIGVFGGLNVAPDAFGVSAGGLFSNGAGTNDILRLYDSGSLVFRVRDVGIHNFAAITHPLGGALSSGDFWRESARTAWQAFIGGNVQTFPTVLFTQTADATHASSVTETTILGTVTGTKALSQLSAQLVVGKAVRVHLKGHLDAVASDTLTFTAYLGAVTLGTTGAITMASSTDVGWEMDLMFTCRSVGASGTVSVAGMVTIGTNSHPIVATATVTVDTTATNQAIDVRADWSAAVAGNSITTQQALGMILN